MTAAIGWAVFEGGKIKLRTVSDTRRAAIVNFLVTERNTMIYSETTDEEIEREWWRLKGGADIGYVTVTAVERMADALERKHDDT